MVDQDGPVRAGRYDVIVVGAGVVGASTARELAHSGARVLLVDRSATPGAGSRAAAGVGVPSVRLLSDPLMLEFATAGRAALDEDVAGLATTNPGPLATRCGLLRPVATQAEADRLARLAEGHDGFLGTWVGADELAELEPGWRGDAHGAFHDPTAMVIDAARYVDGLVAEAERVGVQVRLATAVRRLTAERDRVDVELAPTDAGDRAMATMDGGPVADAGDRALATMEGAPVVVRAGRVVLAAGAWSADVPGAPALPVGPVRGQMVRLAAGPPAAGVAPAGPRRIVSGSLYAAPAPNGTDVLVGATEEHVGFADGPTAEGVLLLLAHVARAWPALRGARLVRAWSGFRAACPDGRPIIGELPQRPRVVVATGHGGQGILTGAHTGRMVARLLGGERVDLDGLLPDAVRAEATR